MNFYKKIVKDKNVRFKILSLLKFIPDKQMLQLQYYIKLHRKLNVCKPERYTEKIQWYKLYYRNEKMPICADKYRVREYINGKGLGHILNELYKVYNSAEEIDLEELPERFVLKTNNGSGTNIICSDKNLLSLDFIKKKFNEYKFQTEVSAGREWVYKDIEPVIIAEKYLEGTSDISDSLIDYKILCFGGKPEYIVCDFNRFSGHKRNIYDTEWNNLNVATDCEIYNREVPKPHNLDEMLRVAKILSEDFPAVRVDLYSINNNIIFGELTFFPWSGYVQYTPDSFDYELGEKFILPNKNY